MLNASRFKFILWDVDDTLVDFAKSERASLLHCFSSFGIELSDADLQKYSEINHGYWRLLEQGKLVKAQVLENRFTDFFDYLGSKDIDPSEMNLLFQSSLADYSVINDGALKLCKELKSSCRQYVVSNGTALAQNKKLKSTGLIDCMEGVFISEALGFEKPDIRFFERAFEQIPDFSRDSALIIGDSLTSDMQGGNNAEIACCWYNPKRLPLPLSPKIDFEINNLNEIKSIL
ncbi:MAG: YjjG family noncanonical pyrimidine nucleotidase [Oscillospiraceae bacterium]